MIFKFRMLCDENDKFVRDYEVPYDMTLLELNDFITQELDYEPTGMTSFFLSDHQWRKLQEFTLMDMGYEGPAEMDEDEEFAAEMPIPMDAMTLGQLLHHVGDRLIWLFDMFADRAYYLELVEPKVADPEQEYPRTAFSHGTPADQFDADNTAEEEKSIFDEMMGDFGDFDGDDNYDDEY